jgi:hypothetical protein
MPLLVLLASPSFARAELSLPRSIEVRVPGAYVRTSPSVQGSRRGTLSFGARLQPLEAREAEGCAAPWYRIGAEAWVCGEHVERSGAEPSARQLPFLEEGEIVPHRYAFAGPDGARFYRSVEDIEYEDWEREFDPRTGLHLRELVDHQGRQYYRTVEGGGFVPAEDVVPARPSGFAGTTIDTDEPVGWVWRRPVQVRPAAGRGRILRRLGHRTGVVALEQSTVGRMLWLRIGVEEWIRDQGLRLVHRTAPPPSVGADERWVHVDRSRQVLTAYEGRRAVYATLVSTGRQGVATPDGTFRIWAKLATAEMSDETDSVDESPYLMQGVPWVMYFNEGVALHGAYWHDEFGIARSHGCVNLAPRDAAFIFEWARPLLPPGWTGVLPTQSDPGTLVVVE